MTDYTKPGLYEDVPYPIYRAIPAKNQSTIKNVIKSPKRAKHTMDHPKEGDALRIGTALDIIALEPHLFNDVVAVEKAVDGRTKVGKAYKEEFSRSSIGKTIINEAEYEKIQLMRDAMMADPRSRQFIERSKKQVMCIWVDEKTGELCKGLFDMYDDDQAPIYYITDMKSAKDASPDGFSKAIANWGYHIQAAYYCDGLRAALGEPNANVVYHFVVVEKEPPYNVGVYELGYDAILEGEAEYRKGLAQYIDCEKTNNWYSYTKSKHPELISIPHWAFKNVTEPTVRV